MASNPRDGGHMETGEVVDMVDVAQNTERLWCEILVGEHRAIENREILNEIKAGLALARTRLGAATEALTAQLSAG